MKIFQYRFKVGQNLLDEYGHVNNARYLELFEEARWAVLEESGLGRNIVKETGVGPVILEVNLRFRIELLPGQEICIQTRSENKGDRIFYFHQEMTNEKGEACCIAVFKGALFDLGTRKMIKADKKWLAGFGFQDL